MVDDADLARRLLRRADAGGRPWHDPLRGLEVHLDPEMEAALTLHVPTGVRLVWTAGFGETPEIAVDLPAAGYYSYLSEC